jgi:hypothetical protein
VKHWLLALATLIVSLAAIAVIGFYAAIMLVGPHADLLPHALQVPVGLLLWAGVLGVPVWLARKVYRSSKAGTRT